jgi:RNA polymerase sigma factor (sigma-70 family)
VVPVSIERAHGSSKSSQRRGRRHDPANDSLIARCLDGDESAWNRLIDRYERLVYAIPLREGLSRHDAAEVSQSTFESLVESLHRIRDPNRLGHWLMTVARRLTWAKKRSRSRELCSEDLLDQPAPDSAIDWERTTAIYEAILELSEPCRSLIIGLFFDPSEPSYSTIAETLGVNVGTVGPLRGRCLARLRKVLESEW